MEILTIVVALSVAWVAFIVLCGGMNICQEDGEKEILNKILWVVMVSALICAGLMSGYTVARGMDKILLRAMIHDHNFCITEAAKLEYDKNN